ncbi:MAG: TSUP family transporter [Usitatibacter sp.]
MITLTALQLALLCAGAAVGGAIFGVIGFAYGVVISVFIHHGFAAPDVVFIVVGGALVLNVGLLPRFWREIRWREALPYMLGATLGLPLGLWLLTQLDPRTIRAFVACLIVAYGLFALRQQSREPFRFAGAHGHAMDGTIGFVGGVIGGVSGLGPLVPGVWFGLRGLTKIEQRCLAQPFGLYVQGFMVTWLLASSTVSRDAIEGLGVATPVMLLAAYLGLRVFDRLSTALFQRGVVVLAILGAVVLLARQL